MATDGGDRASSFFRMESDSGVEVLSPEPLATSTWAGGSTVRGMATSGALARAAERVATLHSRVPMRPTRWTVDLSAPVPSRPLVALAHPLHVGRRTLLIDAHLLDGDRVVARARGLWLALGGRATGQVWGPDSSFRPPEEDTAPGSRCYFSEPVGWTSSATDHQNSSRKQVWQHVPDVVECEPASAFVLAAAAADLASVASHWGDERLQFINVDLTLSLGRLPSGREIGLAATGRVEDGGVAVATATMHDRSGSLGACSTSALAAGDRVVDPSARDSE